MGPDPLSYGMPIDTYLFDLDGTLIDSIELILSSYRHTMRDHLGEVPSDAVWLEGLGTPLVMQFRAFTDDPAEITAISSQSNSYCSAYFLKKSAVARNFRISCSVCGFFTHFVLRKYLLSSTLPNRVPAR